MSHENIVNYREKMSPILLVKTCYQRANGALKFRRCHAKSERILVLVDFFSRQTQSISPYAMKSRVRYAEQRALTFDLHGCRRGYIVKREKSRRVR